MIGYPDFRSKGVRPACQTIDDPEIFYPDIEELGTPGKVEAVIREAKAVCDTCAYTKECFKWAYDNDEPGIWAGTTQRERRLIKRRTIRLRKPDPVR